MVLHIPVESFQNRMPMRFLFWRVCHLGQCCWSDDGLDLYVFTRRCTYVQLIQLIAHNRCPASLNHPKAEITLDWLRVPCTRRHLKTTIHLPCTLLTSKVHIKHVPNDNPIRDPSHPGSTRFQYHSNNQHPIRAIPSVTRFADSHSIHQILVSE